MKCNRIVMLEERRSEDFVLHGDKYVLRSDRGWIWLQKLCFWVLGKIGAHYLETQRTVTYGPFDSPELKNRIHQCVEQAMGWLDFINDPHAIIVMGRDEFQRLVCSEPLRHVFVKTINMRVCVDHGDPRFFGEICDIPLYVVPHLQGMAAIRLPSSVPYFNG